MTDNPQTTPPVEVTEANLEEMTNRIMGGEEPAPETPEQPEEAKLEETAPEAAPPEQAEPQIPEWLKETPYKSPDELVKGYKNLQAEMTRRSQQLKPVEQIADLYAKDPKFGAFLQSAYAMYQSPELQKAYQQPIYERPDPDNYDRLTPEGRRKYAEDVQLYEQRTFNDLLNNRLGAIEAHNKEQLERLQFSQKYPDADINAVDQFFQNLLKDPSSANRYEVAYRLMTYDELNSKALEKARKELKQKMEEASKTGTPKATGTAQKKSSVDDILAYINRYGPGAAEKKFGRATVYKAVEEITNSV